MAGDKKISELPIGTPPTGAEKVEALQGGLNVRLTAQQIANLGAGTVTSVTGTTNRITSSGGATPVINIDAAYDAAITAQISSAVNGTDYKDACNYKTVAPLAANVYNNGSSGVGATLTGVGFGALSFDGSTPSVGDSVLVDQEVSGSRNGIYTVTTVGGVATVYVLTRRADFNQTSNIEAGDATYILGGATKGNTTWVMTTTGVITVGTTALTFVQVQGIGSVPDASSSTKGIAKLYTSTGSNTDGSMDQNSITNALKAVVKTIGVELANQTTPVSAGTSKKTFRMPYAMTLTAVRASLKTAQASGTIFTIDINESGTTILSTKLTIDNTEKTSTTAATPAVISDANLADDAEITMDIDTVGDGTAVGPVVWLIGVIP